ncbi:MAG: hypothetical protein V4683_02280 [Bacteroidota bacterium]
MKKIAISIGIILICMSCKNDLVNPEKLVGKWSHTYYIKDKDQNGNWSDWHQINTLVALPTLEFTSNGKILWEGKPATNCCQYLSYTIDNEVIKLSELTPASAACDCVLCDSWKLEKLTEETLEIDLCYIQARYVRLK